MGRARTVSQRLAARTLQPTGGLRRIGFVGNTCFSLYKFRLGVMRELRARGFEVACIAPQDDYSPKLLAEGFRIHLIDLGQYTLGPLREWRAVKELRALYDKLALDYVFHYTIKPNLYGTFAAYTLGIPSVAVVTGLGIFPDLRNPLLRAAVGVGYRRVARVSRAIWFLNQHDLGFFEGRGWLERARAQVLPSEGVDTEHYTAAPVLSGGGRTLRALFAGRIIGRKGARDFAEAARLLLERGVNVRCQMLGFLEPSNPDGVSVAEVEGWQERGVIDYLGDTQDVRPFIAAADIVVLPTTYREGVSRILLEAMAMARPILTTPNVGTGQLVEHMRNGFLVPPGSPPAIADALAAFAQLNVEHRVRMGQRGRELCRRHYDERRVIAIYLEHLYAYAKTLREQG